MTRGEAIRQIAPFPARAMCLAERGHASGALNAAVLLTRTAAAVRVPLVERQEAVRTAWRVDGLTQQPRPRHQLYYSIELDFQMSLEMQALTPHASGPGCG